MKKGMIVTSLIMMLLTLLTMAVFADELTVTTNVSGGTLSDTVSPLNTESTTLTGKDGLAVSFYPSQYWKVTDARGSGIGWQITVSATVPTTGTKQLDLSNLSVNVNDIVRAADAQSSSDPVVLARAVNKPLTDSTTLVAADVYEGMGSFDYNPVFTLKIPASAYAGTYTSTVTTLLVESPPAI